MSEKFKPAYRYRVIHEDKDGNHLVVRESFNFDIAFNLYDNSTVENGAYATLQKWSDDLSSDSGLWEDVAVRRYTPVKVSSEECRACGGMGRVIV